VESLLKKHETKLRFLIVGGSNTVLDFALLFLLTNLGLSKIVANTISTGTAFIFSFFANKKFTFKNTTKNLKRQLIAFTLVTLSGLWLLQPLIIWIATSFLESHITNEDLNLFIAKVIATAASMVWNYLLYSRLVFIEEKKGE